MSVSNAAIAPQRTDADRSSQNRPSEAIGKLEKERGALKSTTGLQPWPKVIDYLIGRCREDESLCEDVLENQKTFEKCKKHIWSEAGKARQNGDRIVCVDDQTVYEWAEDYYRKDDKAEEEAKAAKKSEKKATSVKKSDSKVSAPKTKKSSKAEEKCANSTKNVELTSESVQKTSESAQKAEQKSARKKSDLDGQMSLFDFM